MSKSTFVFVSSELQQKELDMDGVNDLKDFIEYDLRLENLDRRRKITDLQQQWKALWQLYRKDIWQSLHLTAGNSDYPLNLLVLWSNKVESYLHKYNNLWRHQASFLPLKKLYMEVLNQLTACLDEISSNYPDRFTDISFTNQQRRTVVQQLTVQYRRLERHLNQFDLDSNLSKLMLEGFLFAIRERRLTRRTASILRTSMNRFLIMSPLTTPIVKNTLYQIDFNTPAFLRYWRSGWEQLLDTEDSLHDQLENLIREQQYVNELPFDRNNSFLIEEASLKEELMESIEDKKQSLKELIRVRRIKFRDDEITKKQTRIRINLPVAQFGLFIRLQIEKGILAKEHIGKIFSFYATHFYSLQTEHISPESLQKKSTDVEYATAQKLKGQLIAMINWLNEKY
ncbi:hypothetical protein ABDD95_07385 [Mucilaginibacter sp. PAMB04274]|uniref:hypothetical protein n=1 Tax=Mucilaginibacter sp. PAMB04274 TaxID=3138568 RepID=UPI0031F6E721